MGLLAVVLLIAAVAGIQIAREGGVTTQESVRASAGSSEPVATRTSTPQGTSRPRDIIPGLTAVDITGNVESRGLTCEGPTSEPAGVSWFCSNGTFLVSVSGSTPTRIRAVSASAFGVDDAQAASFLGFIATVPFDDSTPDAARAWVETAISDGGGRTFGSARYTLGGSELGRWLDVTALDR